MLLGPEKFREVLIKATSAGSKDDLGTLYLSEHHVDGETQVKPV